MQGVGCWVVGNEQSETCVASPGFLELILGYPILCFENGKSRMHECLKYSEHQSDDKSGSLFLILC